MQKAKRITAADFKLCYVDGNTYKYFSYEGKNFEITIEPNGFGFDLAHYDHNGVLCGSRINVQPVRADKLPHDTFLRAVRMANGIHEIINAREEMQNA